MFQGLTVGLGTVKDALDGENAVGLDEEADAPVAGSEPETGIGRTEAFHVALSGVGVAEDGVADLAGDGRIEFAEVADGGRPPDDLAHRPSSRLSSSVV